MIAETLTLAIVQTQLHWQDSAANHQHFERLLAQAKGADLIILPEMFNTGFSMESAALAEPENGPSTQWLLQQAKGLDAVVCASLIIGLADGTYRNRLLWARPDGSVAYYDKRHLFRMAGEHLHFSAGEEQVLLELKGWKIRPLICYDLRFPVWSRDPQHTDLLLYTANWPAVRRAQWCRLLPARAIENLCYVVGVNRIGIDGNQLSYSGDSQVLDMFGEPVLDCASADGVFWARLDRAALTSHRERFPAYQDADPFVLTSQSSS